MAAGLRPWDGLNLPAGWEQVLGSGSGVSDRRARELPCVTPSHTRVALLAAKPLKTFCARAAL